MNLIIKFYYCKICGPSEDKTHILNHENNNEYFGYQVFYEEETNKIYIQYMNDTDWLYEGNKHNLNYLIKNDLDLQYTDRYINNNDYNYHEIRILYNKLAEYLF
jgi:hypothetical protein